jgi:hypothetical protein
VPVDGGELGLLVSAGLFGSLENPPAVVQPVSRDARSCELLLPHPIAATANAMVVTSTKRTSAPPPRGVCCGERVIQAVR